MDAPGTLVEVAVVPEVNVTAPELTNENDEAAPLVTLDAIADKLTFPDNAIIGTTSLESPPVFTVTIAALASAVVKPPGLKFVTDGVPPNVNVNVVLAVIEPTGVVGTPMKLTPEAVPPV